MIMYKIIFLTLISHLFLIKVTKSYNIVDLTLKDSTRNAETQFCALKKTTVEDDYNGIIYNFTSYTPIFNACFNYLNLTFFKINGTVFFNQSFASIYFYHTNETFTILNNDTISNSSILLSDRTPVNISFNETNLLILFDSFNKSIQVNKSNVTTVFDENILVETTVPESMAIFIPVKSLKCSLKKIVSNLATKLTQIIILGGNGPYDASDSFKQGLVFLPEVYSINLQEFVNLSNPNGLSVSLRKSSLYDHGILLLFFIAVFTILCGSLWSKHEFNKVLYKRTKIIVSARIYQKQYYDNPFRQKEISTDEHIGTYKKTSSAFDVYDKSIDVNFNKKNETTIVQISNLSREKRFKCVKLIFENDLEYDNIDIPQSMIEFHSIGYIGLIMLVSIAITFIVLLFFFYDIMIYFIYVSFATGSCRGIYNALCLLFNKLEYYSYRFPKVFGHFHRLLRFRYFSFKMKANMPFFRDHRLKFNLFKIILASVCLIFVIIWFIYRNEYWIWVIQDIMGVSITLLGLSIFRIYSLKYITILLTLFFLYDVFMVFITPFITGGISVMEAVVNGGISSIQAQDSKNIGFGGTKDFNRLPIIISIPNLSYSKQLCQVIYNYGFTSLGLGDILIPGLCVNFAIIYDTAASNSFPIYFFFNLIGYSIGLVLAFVGFVFWNSAQPALFYICPVLIILNIVMSLIRKEFKLVWSGDMVKKYVDVNSGNDENLSKYKNKKVWLFNIIKLTNRPKLEDDDNRENLSDSLSSNLNQIEDKESKKSQKSVYKLY